VWFQGCTIHCTGCQNPQTWDANSGTDVSPEDLAYQIVKDAPKGTDGITISGGEPLNQALSLYRFLSMIRAIRPHWTRGMFTGYTLTELTIGNYQIVEGNPMPDREKALLWEYQIKDALTFAITGRYDKTRPTLDVDYALYPHLRMCSSRNQCLWLFKRKYNYSDFPILPVEFSISEDGGLVSITGFPG
jgi:anaerobic ribonucleoside-triphosphate reductase activating protein